MGLKTMQRSVSAPTLYTECYCGEGLISTGPPLTRCASAPTIPEKRSVSFTNVEIREYALSLGDHPDSKQGPPISLSWDYEEKGSMELLEYETKKLGNRRNRNEFYMHAYQRKNILCHLCGYTEEEIRKAQKEGEKIRRQRRVSRNMYQIHLAGRMMKGLILEYVSHHGSTDTYDQLKLSLTEKGIPWRKIPSYGKKLWSKRKTNHYQTFISQCYCGKISPNKWKHDQDI